ITGRTRQTDARNSGEVFHRRRLQSLFQSIFPAQRLNVFPSEIACEIFQQCDLNTLTRIALLDKDHQSAAEPLIYRTLQFYEKELRSGNLEKCLETLSVWPKKALYVRHLEITLVAYRFGLFGSGLDDKSSLFQWLSSALIATSKLQTLILVFRNAIINQDWVPILPDLLLPALRNCTFSPRTVIVVDDIHPAKWLERWDNLQNILIYSRGPLVFDDTSQRIYQQWISDSSATISFGAYCSSVYHLVTIQAFPELQPRWSARPIKTVLDDVWGEFDDYDSVFLVLRSIKTQALVEILTSLVESFPNVRILELEVEDGDIHESHNVFLSALSLLPKLADLSITTRKVKVSNISFERTVQLAELYALCCPQLKWMRFGHPVPDSSHWSRSTLVREDGCTAWTGN
ncbi:hypothetical protein H0H93_010008, partial [Arthromyces matolae]